MTLSTCACHQTTALTDPFRFSAPREGLGWLHSSLSHKQASKDFILDQNWGLGKDGRRELCFWPYLTLHFCWTQKHVPWGTISVMPIPRVPLHSLAEMRVAQHYYCVTYRGRGCEYLAVPALVSKRRPLCGSSVVHGKMYLKRLAPSKTKCNNLKQKLSCSIPKRF